MFVVIGFSSGFTENSHCCSIRSSPRFGKSWIPPYFCDVCANCCVCGNCRCVTWPESKSPVIKDLAMLLGRSKVPPSELSNHTEGEIHNILVMVVLLVIF